MTEETSKNEKVKRPEFIIIDNTSDYLNAEEVKEDEQVLSREAGGNPIAIRILCILGIFAALIFGMGMIIGFIVRLGWAAIHLFQNTILNQTAARFWKLIKHTIVVIISLLIALFSPTLGFGFMMLYFSMRGNSKDKELLKRTLNKII